MKNLLVALIVVLSLGSCQTINITTTNNYFCPCESGTKDRVNLSFTMGGKTVVFNGFCKDLEAVKMSLKRDEVLISTYKIEGNLHFDRVIYITNKNF